MLEDSTLAGEGNPYHCGSKKRERKKDPGVHVGIGIVRELRNLWSRTTGLCGEMTYGTRKAGKCLAIIEDWKLMIMIRKDEKNTLRRILIPYIVHNILDLFPSQVHDPETVNAEAQASLPYVRESPHLVFLKNLTKQMVYKYYIIQSSANCYPCTSVRWRREASRHLCLKREILAHQSMYASVTAETHAT